MAPIHHRLFLVFAGIALSAAGRMPAAERVDLAPALRVDGFEVSHYLVEKYFRRFVNAEQQKFGGPPGNERCKAWLQAFLIRQALVPRALALGYGDRPEVVSVVERMERYMLTQPHGPLYAGLYDSAPIPPERLARLYRQSAVTVDALLVRFTDARARAALGDDLEPGAPSEKAARLLRACRVSGVVWHDGTLNWPFGPFAEIADVLAEGDVWIEARGPGGTAYFAQVRSRTRRPQPALAAVEAEFAAFVRQFDRELVQRRRRETLLAEAGFEFAEPVGTRWAERLSGLMAEAPQIPPDVFRPLAGERLFRYRIGEREVTVGVEEHARWFNALLVRQLPQTVAAVRASAEAMAMEEIDLRAARAAGVDQSPQFSEDRKGFRHLQALEWFERERLEPSIVIPEAEFEAYRDEHAKELVRTTAIRGRLATFRDGSRASAWLAQAVPSSQPEDLQDAGVVVEVEVRADRALPGFEAQLEALLRLPPGSRFGPVRRDEGYAVFLKEKDVESVPLPPEEMAEIVRLVLIRQRLDALERRLAAELLSQSALWVDPDLARYGVTGPLDLPWR